MPYPGGGSPPVWKVVSHKDGELDTIVRADDGYIRREVVEEPEEQKAPPNVTASIPFWRLFKPVTNSEEEPRHKGGGDGDLITTFEIASRHIDASTGRTIDVENRDLCKSFRIDGNKDVVFKITFGVADSRKRRRDPP